MTTHKIRFLAVLALAVACEPGVPQTASPASVVTAVFDPISGQIPLPNDLALQRIPTTLPPAQQDLLNAFKAEGGFPNDQEVPVTISFVRTNIAADGSTTNVAPVLDTATLTPATLAVFLRTAQGSGPVALDPITDANYANLGDRGVLTLHNKNRAPWTPGQYVVGVRGGPNGVKTKEGDPIYASATFYLIAQGQNLETEQNLVLLRAQTGSAQAALDAARQLDQIIDAYKLGAFPAVNQVFPQQELAAMTTFAIAPLKTQVQLDANRGLVPLPIDLLRDPRPASATCPACGKLTPLAACTLAQGTLDAQGVCRDSKGNVNAAAAGFAALDGFSTTGMILSPLSDLVQSSTVTSSTVQLWELSSTAAPAKVDPSTYLTEPVEVTQQGLSPVIALQPAGATASDPSNPIPSVFRTRPLKDNTDYAVVISDGVKDKTGRSIAPGTAAKILQFTHPVVDGSGTSQLQGVDNQTAGALEVMRQKLAPVLSASGFGTGHVAMAYTFHTQTITSTAVQLGALPYLQPASTGVTIGSIANSAPDAAFQKYGVDPAGLNLGGGGTRINEILETKIKTFELLDPATGAFNPNPAAAALVDIDVIIATPKAASVATCALPPPLDVLNGLKCSPLVVFRHGLGGGRLDMLAVADSLAAKGFTTVAIDAAKHGDRSFCTSGQATLQGVPQCTGAGVQCQTQLPAGAQGDANPPGKCAAGQDFIRRPVSPACQINAATCSYTPGPGIPVVSSNYLVSANFFRTRDTLRQDIIDQSQLVRAVAAVSSATVPNPLFEYMKLQTVIVDPLKIYFAGQSLGAIQGTVDVATNPRISRAVLNVGGGTVVDVFTTSPAFAPTTNALLASLGIQPGANSAYLQFLVVAKTILDPADPVNFAGHLTTTPTMLPDLLTNPNGSVKQAVKAVLTQAAFCDQTVPNPWNYLLDSTAGTGPMPLPPLGFPAAHATFELFMTGAPTTTALSSCPTPTSTSPNAIPHGFFTNWSAATGQAQTDAATFLVDPANSANVPPSVRSF